MSNDNWLNKGRDDCTTWIGLGWNPLESVQQAPVYQPDPVRDRVDRTQGREHAVSDELPKPTVYSYAPDDWWCAVGGKNRPINNATVGWGKTKEEAYALWMEHYKEFGPTL